MAGIYDDIKCKKKRSNDFQPTQYQSEVIDYFVNVSTYKGLLLYHKLGAGKTCTSVMIADDMLRKKKIKKVYVLTPGSLRVNWIDEYCKKCGDKFISSHFIFMTYNSDLKRELDSYNFDGSLVIIDEAHNIFNGVRNLSNNPLAIYKKIYESNCRVLLLTGTPIIQYIFEWSLMGNILNPNGFKNILRYDGHKPYLVEDAFNHKSVTNKEYQGIVSYYPGNKDLYPTTIYHEPIKCMMSKEQTILYLQIMHLEDITLGIGPPKQNDPNYMFKYQNYIKAVKRIPSRKISNANSNLNLLRIYNSINFMLSYLPLLEAKYVDEKNNRQMEGKSNEEIDKAYDIQIELIQSYIQTYMFEKEAVMLGFNNLVTQLYNNNNVDTIMIPDEIKELVAEFKITRLKLKNLNRELESITNRISTQYHIQLAFNDIIENHDKNIIEKLFPNKPKIILNKKKNNADDGDDGDDDDENKSMGLGYSSKWAEDGLFQKYPNLLFSFSSKYIALLINIVSRLKTKHVIFTFFKSGIGIETISKILGRCGITYGIFSGDINDNERRRVLEVFNSVENRDGKLMNILFITEAGAEGISLLEVNNMHILESSTREHKITQAIGRVARIFSHVNMPQNRQYVNVWRYWSTCYPLEPPNDSTIRSPQMTIDEILYNKGQIIEEGKNVFLSRLIQNSIEISPANPDDMPKVKNYANKLSGLSNKFYDIVDKSITEFSFDKPNSYALLPFTTSSIKIPEESKNFLSMFPNIERRSGYYRVPYNNTTWATLESRNEAGSYIIVNNKNINVIFAFIQQTLNVPKKIVDPLQPQDPSEKYKDRFGNIDKILKGLSNSLPVGSTVAIPSSIGTNGETKFMSVIHDIISDVGKANTGIKFKLYIR
jgi:superfamily II DNA or RNA helicase